MNFASSLIKRQQEEGWLKEKSLFLINFIREETAI